MLLPPRRPRSRGQEVYEFSLRQHIEAGNEEKIVAFNINPKDVEVAETIMVATDRLLKRQPDAQTWTIRIGHRAVYHFGSRSLKQNNRKIDIEESEPEPEPLLGMVKLYGV